MMLSSSVVRGIQNQGGSILGNGRGGLQGYEDEVFDFITRHNIRLLFVIGGDGTHRGANLLAKRAAALNPPYPLSVAGIPKTIDNDIGRWVRCMHARIVCMCVCAFVCVH